MHGKPFKDVQRQFLDQLALHRLARDIGGEELVFWNVIGIEGALRAARDLTRWSGHIEQEPIGCCVEAHPAWEPIASKPLKLETVSKTDT